MRHMLARFIHQEDGATAIEYGLIATFISLAIAVAVMAFGQTLSELFFDRLPEMFASIMS